MQISFRAITASLAASLLVTPALAAVTPAQIVENIRALTSKSQALQSTAQSITYINGPLIIVGQGPFPQIIAGFKDIVSTATEANTAMQGTPEINGAKAGQEIADAFREFVRVNQVLLNILIGKSGLFSTAPFVGGPVAAVLREVEAVYDTLAFMLIDLIAPQADELNRQHASLSGTITVAINSYDGLEARKVRRAIPAEKEGMVGRLLIV